MSPAFVKCFLGTKSPWLSENHWFKAACVNPETIYIYFLNACSVNTSSLGELGTHDLLPLTADLRDPGVIAWSTFMCWSTFPEFLSRLIQERSQGMHSMKRWKLCPYRSLLMRFLACVPKVLCQTVCFWEAGTGAWQHDLIGPFETSLCLMWLGCIQWRPVALLSNPMVCVRFAVQTWGSCWLTSLWK